MLFAFLLQTSEMAMNIWNQQSQHDLVADVFRTAPAKKVAKRCGTCRSFENVYAATIARADDQSAMMAYRCECCGTEWIDYAAAR